MLDSTLPELLTTELPEEGTESGASPLLFKAPPRLLRSAERAPDDVEAETVVEDEPPMPEPVICPMFWPYPPETYPIEEP